MKKLQYSHPAFFCCIFLVLFACDSNKPETEPETPIATEYPAFGISSTHHLAEEAGLQILENGGNAFDAAIASAAVLAVVEPQHSGLGGYGNALIFDAAKGKADFLSFSGKYPEQLDRSVFRNAINDLEAIGNSAKAISTPTAVAGWYAMHEQYGKLPWPDLFQPAIRYAKDGFPVDKQLANDLGELFGNLTEEAKTILGKDNPLKEGQLLKQEALAGSLIQIAQQGPSAFNSSQPIGKSVLQLVRDQNGYLNAEDLNAMEANWGDPISIQFQGHEVVSTGAPTAGFMSLQQIGESNLFDLRSVGHNSVDYFHVIAESAKHSFWTYLRYAGSIDTILPNFTMILSGDYWKWMAQNIQPAQASEFYPPFDFEYVEEQSNTTHLVVADKQGNIVSMTMSLGDLFGSKIFDPATGIWLNNGIKYAVWEQEGTPRDALPGKLRVVMDAPLMIFKDGKPKAALGTPGGIMMPQLMAQSVNHYLVLGYDLKTAISLPMLGFDGNKIIYENGISEAVIDQMKGMGHEFGENKKLGNIRAIEVKYSPAGEMIGVQSMP